ncbi:MAG: hypothetical protein ACM3O8_10695 [Methylococcaceae bacterium]|nr:hypothetical protein [Prolixibacteraceae bacterium]
MRKPNAADSLKESIRLLEIRQAEEGREFKEQFKLTYESLKPANIIKSTIRDLAYSVEVKNNLFDTLLSLLSGYIAKKILTDSKSGFFSRILRVFAHFGITNMIANNSEEIRLYLANLIEKFFTPKEKVVETEV